MARKGTLSHDIQGDARNQRVPPSRPGTSFDEPGVSTARPTAVESRAWTSRSNSVDTGRAKIVSKVARSTSIADCSPVDSNVSPWHADRSAPYETNAYLPNPTGAVRPSKPPQTAPDTHVLTPPLTPPEKYSGTFSHPDMPRVRALPGTMSTRQTDIPNDYRRRQRQAAQRDLRSDADEDKDKLGDRMKSAFRSIFRKKSTNESDFERIGETHWTDE